MFRRHYLSGKIDEETGEVTITGLRPAGYITPHSLTDESAYQWVYMRVDEIVIPNEIDGHPVTRILRDAFSCRKKIEGGETGYVSTTKRVVIGDNVQEIESSAFEELPYLQSVSFGKSLRVIGDSSFRDCYALESVTFGENLEMIGEHAFGNCPRLREIQSWGNHLREIHAFAFHDITGITDGITLVMPPLPKTIALIDVAAFASSSVKSLVILNNVY